MPGIEDGSRSKAPFVVFGGMILIALVGLLIVLIGHCRRDEPYLDPDRIAPGQEGRVPPPRDYLPPAAPALPPAGSAQ